jgi:putative PIG3 family NAD(P)H quinone oxidoreductase
VRAVVVARPGDPDVLEFRDVPRPEPGPGEIRVRVRAFGVNRADLLQRLGRYPAPPGEPADILGLEFAGTVSALGPGAARFAVGDTVMGLSGGGAYAEEVVVAEGHAVAIPRKLDAVAAAAVPEAFVTAHDALRRANVREGQWVLIHAVASSVGLATLQLARAWGAHCVGTSRTAAKLERARAFGLDVGVDTSTGSFGDAVVAATDGGVHAVIDLIGGSAFPETLATLRSGGHLVLVGLTAGRNADLDLGLVLRKRLHIEGTVLRPRSRDEKTTAVTAFADDVLPLLAAGTVRPVVHTVFPFDRVADAHRLMGANANVGKIVVEVA